MELMKEIASALEQGDDERVAELTTLALSKQFTPKDILDNGLIAGMNTVGELFRNHELFLPDVLLAAKAMYAGMELLKPLMISDGIPSTGKIVIGTVQGDLHDIGKNLVGIMLKGAGYEVIDLGKDVPPERFVTTAVNEGASIIGMSALLTTTMPVMKQVMEQLRNQGLLPRIKVIIGGAPVSHEYAKSIGADAYSFDAANAVDIVKQLLGK